MKQFILKILLVAFLTLVIATVIQLVISFAIKDKTINGQDNFHVIKNQKNDIIFLGSSRCTEHFDPKFFRDSFGLRSVNLGVNGHGDITMQNIRLNYYLAYNPPPRIVMLNFDPIGALGPYDISKNENLIEKHYYARYAFWPKNEDTMLTQYFHFNFAERYVPLYALLKYRAILDCITMKGGKKWLKDGYQKHDVMWDTVAHPIAGQDWDFRDFIRDADSIKAHLSFFNDLCKRNNIKLVCVQSPVYRSVYNREAFGIPKSICDDLGILFIDTNEEPIINDIRNFADADHLNTAGVTKMLNIVAKNKGFLELVQQ